MERNRLIAVASAALLLYSAAGLPETAEAAADAADEEIKKAAEDVKDVKDVKDAVSDILSGAQEDGKD